MAEEFFQAERKEFSRSLKVSEEDEKVLTSCEDWKGEVYRYVTLGLWPVVRLTGNRRLHLRFGISRKVLPVIF